RCTPTPAPALVGCTDCSTASPVRTGGAAMSRCGGSGVSVSHSEQAAARQGLPKGRTMKLSRCTFPVALAFLAGLAGLARSGDDKTEVKEQSLEASNGVTVKVRMEGPYTADVPLQVVCYFKYTPEGAK